MTNVVEFRRKRNTTDSPLTSGKDPVKLLTYQGRTAWKITEDDFMVIYGSCGEVLVTIDLRTAQVVYTHEEFADVATKTFWEMLALRSPLYRNVLSEQDKTNGLQVE